jgi:hypothetical protein
LADIEGFRFGVKVVELEHDRVALAAVDARMFVEVVKEIGGALESERLLPGSRLIDVALPVR